MAKKIRFPLKMAEGVEVKDLEQLKEHFDLRSVVEYYKNGKLLNWLEARYLEGEAEAVQNLDDEAPDFQKSLCEIFGVEFTGDEVDLEAIALRQERLKKLRAITDEAEYIDNIERLAFDQEELADLLDENENVIYLCGKKFTVPASRKDITYIGIQNPEVHISGEIPQERQNLGISFRECKVDNFSEEPEQEPELVLPFNNSLDQKIAMLFREESKCYCKAITENYLIFEKVKSMDFWSLYEEDDKDALEEGHYCLNLSTMEVKRVPDSLCIPLYPVILGDRLIYHLGGEDHVKYFDAAEVENGYLIDCKRSQYLDASPDYVLAGMWHEAKLLDIKSGEVYDLDETYGKILGGEIYTLGLNENQVYNPKTGVTQVAKGVTWDFWPEKVCGDKVYGTVHGICAERDVKVMDKTTGKKRNLFKYFRYDCDSRISICDGYWVVADQNDYYKDPIVIRAIELETSEVRKIASLPPAHANDIIGVINNYFYYRTAEKVQKGRGESETVWHLYKVSLENPERREEI